MEGAERPHHPWNYCHRHIRPLQDLHWCSAGNKLYMYIVYIYIYIYIIYLYIQMLKRLNNLIPSRTLPTPPLEISTYITSAAWFPASIDLWALFILITVSASNICLLNSKHAYVRCIYLNISLKVLIILTIYRRWATDSTAAREATATQGARRVAPGAGQVLVPVSVFLQVLSADKDLQHKHSRSS